MPRLQRDARGRPPSSGTYSRRRRPSTADRPSRDAARGRPPRPSRACGGRPATEPSRWSRRTADGGDRRRRDRDRRASPPPIPRITCSGVRNSCAISASNSRRRCSFVSRCSAISLNDEVSRPSCRASLSATRVVRSPSATRSAASMSAPIVRAFRQSHRPPKASPARTAMDTAIVIEGAGWLPVKIDARIVASAATNSATASRATNAPRRNRRPDPNGGPPIWGGPCLPPRRPVSAAVSHRRTDTRRRARSGRIEAGRPRVRSCDGGSSRGRRSRARTTRSSPRAAHPAAGRA